MKFVCLFLLIVSSLFNHFLAQKDEIGMDKNGNGTLGLIYQQNACGLNYVQASRKVTSRNAAGGAGSGIPCTLSISGIPACYTIERAYLWAVGSFGISAPAPGASVNFSITNPLGIVTASNFALAGSHNNKCWSESFSGCYRADVTSLITGNGNYIINSTGFSTTEIDGMTLLIVYRDLVSGCTYNGRIFLNDGMMVRNSLLALTASYTLAGTTPCATPIAGQTRVFGINSDFQLGLLNHSFGISGTGVSSGSGTFADAFYNFDQRSPTISATTNSVTFSTTGLNLSLDCFGLAMTGLYYRTAVGGACAACVHPYTLSTSNSGPVCLGDDLSLGSNVSPTPICGTNYSWTGPNSFTSTSANPTRVSVVLADDGLYNVDASFPSTCLTNLTSSTDAGVVSCLAVELIDFVGQNISNTTNKLNWRTASENESDYFILERLNSSNEWIEVERIKAKGYSISVTDYEVIDRGLTSIELTLNNQISLYRLIEVDINGKRKNLKIVSIESPINKFDCVLIKADKQQVSFINQIPNATILIFNSYGQSVFVGKDFKTGVCNINDLSLSSGYYFLSIKGESCVETIKFFVK